jgi:hypothetical protein
MQKLKYTVLLTAVPLLTLSPLLIPQPVQNTPAPSRAADPNHDYPVQPVPFTSVHVHDSFWAPKIETNRSITIPSAFAQCERTGRVDNFIRAAEAIRGENLKDRRPPGYPFDDTDLYKVIEGASYTLSVHPDPKLDAYVDSLIAKIAAAQEGSRASASLGRHGALAERRSKQPRTLQPGSPVRSSGGALSSHRQAQSSQCSR